jgi:hypothetical protein
MQVSLVFMSKEQPAYDAVMSVGEDIRLDLNAVADNSFDWKTSCVDLWIDALNDNSLSSICRLRHEQTGLAGVSTILLSPEDDRGLLYKDADSQKIVRWPLEFMAVSIQAR